MALVIRASAELHRSVALLALLRFSRPCYGISVVIDITSELKSFTKLTEQ